MLRGEPHVEKAVPQDPLVELAERGRVVLTLERESVDAIARLVRLYVPSMPIIAPSHWV